MIGDLHEPDQWILVRLTRSATPESLVRVFATWDSSRWGPDEERMSSDLLRIDKRADGLIDCHCDTGSIYRCKANAHGLSDFGASVLARKKTMSEPHVRIEQITLEQALAEVMDDPVAERLRQSVHEADFPTLGDVLQLVEYVLVNDPDWMDRPHPSLGGATPSSLCDTQEGRVRVVGILGAIRYGIPP